MNKAVYGDIIDKVKTDEIIITNERIEHIINRRGKEFYDTYKEYFPIILSEPDYIFENKKNTLLVCKKISVEGKYINIALRLIVSTEIDSYKNSIITVVGENNSRFERRLRNNMPIYKRE